MSQRRSVRTRQPRRLVGKLSAYATAGVALGATDATSAVIYTDLGTNGVTVTNAFAMDLNADGQIDFSLDPVDRFDPRFCETTSSGNFSCTGDFFFAKGLEINARRSNGVHVSTRNTQVVVVRNEAIQYAQGMMIPPVGGLRSYGFLAMSYRASTSSSGQCDGFGACYGYLGKFLDAPRGYVGLVLDLPDGPHAGWADIEWRGLDTPAKIYGFAYESDARVPIIAGDTGASTSVPGDTNADGTVDLEDLNNVRNNFGASGDAILGDTNDDDLVDLEDLNAVRNNFGAGNPVPEPPSLVLLAAGATGFGVLRRKRATSE